jgi:hypothetical protein
MKTGEPTQVLVSCRKKKLNCTLLSPLTLDAAACVNRTLLSNCCTHNRRRRKNKRNKEVSHHNYKIAKRRVKTKKKKIN